MQAFPAKDASGCDWKPVAAELISHCLPLQRRAIRPLSQAAAIFSADVLSKSGRQMCSGASREEFVMPFAWKTFIVAAAAIALLSIAGTNPSRAQQSADGVSIGANDLGGVV